MNALITGVTLIFAAQVASAAPLTCPPSARVITPAQLQVIHAQAVDRGMLWRAERNGKPFYLYASMHLGKREWFAPGPALKSALSQSHRLFLELDPFAPQGAASVASAAAAPKKKPLYMAASPHWQSSINQLARDACIPEQTLVSMNVFSRLRTLGYAQAQYDGMHRVYSLERMLSNYARSRHMPVIALETTASQALALQPSSAKAAKHMVDTTLTQLLNGTSRRVNLRMATAWEKGDLADLDAYQSWCECASNADEQTMLKHLNDERNIGFAQRLTKEHSAGGPFVVAVGALHMTGENALPKLLAQQGFKLTRLH